MCFDEKGNVNTSTYIAMRDTMTVREFLDIEEARAVHSSKQNAINEWAKANA